MLIEKFEDDKGDLYIKYPLINNLFNDRGWRTTREANEVFAGSVVGTALSLVPNKLETPWRDYHPFLIQDGATVLDQIKHAFRYAVGINVGVTKDSGKYKGASGEIPWFGIAKITEPFLKEVWKKPDSELPPIEFSAGIIQGDGPDDAISSYRITHVAILPKGAYGPTFRKIASCEGTAETCVPILKGAASVELLRPETAYKERCGMCPLDAAKAISKDTQFSSYFAKSASSKQLNMVNNSSQTATATDAPNNGAVGVSDSNDSAGSPLRSIGYADTAKSNTETSTSEIGANKPVLKYRLIPASTKASEQPDEDEGEGEGQGQGGQNEENEESKNANNSSGIGAELQRKLQKIEEQQRISQREREQDRVIGAVKDLLVRYPQLYLDGTKRRFQQKKFEEDLRKYTTAVLNKEINLQFLEHLIDVEAKSMPIEVEAQQIRRASSIDVDRSGLPYPYNLAPISSASTSQLKGAGSSSLKESDDNEDLNKKLGGLYRLIKGGQF